MTLRAVVVLGVTALAAGCVYYNSLYNAERLFEEGERYRRAGRDSIAVERFGEVIDKAAKGFREEPEGPWADDALLLMGRAHLRRGDLRAGRAALRRATEIAETEEGRLRARMYLGISYALAGDGSTAIPLLNEALRGLRSQSVRAEGHLWRGRIFLASGQVDAGWWDLDQAGGLDSGARLDAALERAGWGIHYGEATRTREGFTRLLGLGDAADRVDTVAALARVASLRWGPAQAADLLSPSDTSRWPRTSQGRIRLERARLLTQAGDTAGARRMVQRVADGYGDAAAEARMELAGGMLAGARDLAQARAAIPLLLPASEDPSVRRLLLDVEALTQEAAVGLDEPLGWFAAGETARDRLGAPDLARGFFLAYVDAAGDEPWTAKALLAALAVTTDVGDREWLRGRLDGRSGNPYVLAARGEPAPGIEELEEELSRRLEDIRSR